MTAPGDQQATYLARLTPPGKGAIAVLGLYGPEAWTFLEQLYQPFGKGAGNNPFTATRQAGQAPGKFWLGRLGEAGSAEADELVIALRQPSPQACFEIHCHGGAQAVAALEDLFAARGVWVCSWHEWL